MEGKAPNPLIMALANPNPEIDPEVAGAANLLIMPNLDAANIAFNFAKGAADGLHISPILLGTV